MTEKLTAEQIKEVEIKANAELEKEVREFVKDIEGKWRKKVVWNR